MKVSPETRKVRPEYEFDSRPCKTVTAFKLPICARSRIVLSRSHLPSGLLSPFVECQAKTGARIGRVVGAVNALAGEDKPVAQTRELREAADRGN